MKIEFEPLYPGVVPPVAATELAAGLDAVACLEGRNLVAFTKNNTRVEQNDSIVLWHGWRAIVPLGFKAKLPPGYECQVRPRSGLALKSGITVLNTPGTIDADYPGEWGVVLYNTTEEAFSIRHGDRIAQLVLAPVVRLPWEQAVVTETTDRVGGFGSTGT